MITSPICDDCPEYINPIEKLIYPNTDNEAVGWVKCGRGNIIKRKTMACHYHPANAKEDHEQEKKTTWDKKKVPCAEPLKPTIEKAFKKSEKHDLVGGKDFGKALINDIENMFRGL